MVGFHKILPISNSRIFVEVKDTELLLFLLISCTTPYTNHTLSLRIMCPEGLEFVFLLHTYILLCITPEILKHFGTCGMDCNATNDGKACESKRISLTEQHMKLNSKIFDVSVFHGIMQFAKHGTLLSKKFLTQIKALQGVGIFREDQRFATCSLIILYW